MKSSLHRILSSFLLSTSAGLVIAVQGAAGIDEPPPIPSPTQPPAQSEAQPSVSPNQALAVVAKEIIIKSLKPQYEKRENWGHQSTIVDGYHWVQRAGGWHLEKQTKPVNDGLWRMYSVRLNDPEHNLQVRLTPAHPADDGHTAFQAFLTARLAVDARQEQWIKGVKGLNFQVQGDATVEVRLDLEIAIKPATEGGFGSIEIQPVVTNVGLRLVDLSLKRLDLIHGDLARELGNAFEDILAGELHKREAETTRKINAEIEKHRDKLRFSPGQIAEIGWDKIQAILGGGSSASKSAASSATPPTKR